jgi:hypothetical protein
LREKFAKGDDDAPAEQVFTLLGMDTYLLTFIAVAGGFVLLGIFWLFFSRLPIPNCGGRYGLNCRTIFRDPAPTKQEGPAKPPGSPPRAIAAL